MARPAHGERPDFVKGEHLRLLDTLRASGMDMCSREAILALRRSDRDLTEAQAQSAAAYWLSISAVPTPQTGR